MQTTLFDWPIVLQYDVKAKYQLISGKFSGMKVLISPERFLNQPKAIPVCIRSINQSNRSISFRLLFCFFSGVFISRSYENRSKKTVNTYTEAVTHFKGLPHAICEYLFKMDKQSLLINWFRKTMVQFCLTFLHYMTFISVENVSCCCRKGLARINMDWLEKVELTFSSFNAIQKNCHYYYYYYYYIFFITLREQRWT